MMTEKNALVEIREVSKRFVNTQALDKVSFDVRPGEVHGLIGENGAGKSTLARILAGSQTKDSGQILFEGDPLGVLSVFDSVRKGICMVFQESNLIPSISVAENLFLGGLDRFKKLGVINWKLVNQIATQQLQEVHLTLNPRVVVSELDFGVRKLIEFARAVYLKPRLLILDEISACLSQEQVNIVFDWIRRAVREGKSVIYISHRMEEVFEVCNRATILKDGKLVETVNPIGMSVDQLSSMTVGRNIVTSYHLYGEQKARIHVGSEVLLEAERLSKAGDYRNVSFQAHQGEIVGFAGLDGSGTEEVLKTLFGVYSPDQGQIRISGKQVRITGIPSAKRIGLGYVPKEREREGLINLFSIRHNVTLAILNILTRWIFLNIRRELAIAREFREKLDIRSKAVDDICNSLSGGNKQKVVIAKWLAANSRILLLNNPTRGVDVGVKAEIYKLIFELASNGVTVLLVSGELPEIIRLSHKVITMAHGEITGEFSQNETMLEEEQLIKTMV